MDIRKFIKNNRNTIFRLIFVIFSAMLILYSLPHELTSKVKYSEGLRWGHGEVVTEFGFPISKSEQQINDDQKNIRENFAPYYIKVDSVQAIVLDSIATYSSFITEEVKNTIRSYYNTGVIGDDNSLQLKNDKKEIIKIQTSNIEATPEYIGKIYTPDNIISSIIKTYYDSDSINKKNVEDILRKYIKPNLIYDESSSTEKLNEALENASVSDKYIEKGEIIISRGEIVDNEKKLILDSYYKELANRTSNKDDSRETTIAGQALIIILALGILFWYLSSYDKELKTNTKKFILTITMASIFPIMIGIAYTFDICDEYILPLALTPMILSLFTDSKTSIVAHTISVLICSMNVTNPYEFILLQLFAGYIATFVIRDLSSRLQMFHCVLLIFLTYSLTYVGYTLITEKSFSSIDYIMLAYFAINSVILLFTYPLMFVIEQLFGFISSITLIELSNVNNKLLTKLSQNAAGTFQHSMQVGNLAAEAAQKIGADSLLIRIGALYHDIGKMNNTIYFTENQNSNISPHSGLSPLESAKIIIKHVTDGVAIADKHNLPRPIKDFILTHHGITKPGVFYFEYKKQHPDEVIDDALFTYPGPMPSTAEQGILMLADSVEAASKSLKEHTAENISELVDRIVDSKVKNGELNQCPLTFQNVNEIKECFKKRLMSIYHTRVSYPKEATEIKKDKTV